MRPIINKVKSSVKLSNHIIISHLSTCQLMSEGEDIIIYRTACADSIPMLEIFKSNCMPIFLFLAEGDLVAFVHGADGRRMREVIREEVTKEMSIKKEGAARNVITLEEAVPISVYEEED